VSGPLVIIGGAEQRDRPGSVLVEFAGLCGRPPGTIAVCGEASADPSAMLEIYRAAFGQLGYDVEPLSAEDVATGAWSSRLDDAVGVFFTGGSQARLMENVGRSEFVDGLRRRWHEGYVIAGSSAGASAMGRVMIETGAARTKPSDAEVEIADGLGLVDAVIDQHFAERGRIHRLLAAVAASGCLGIGIDEDTAIVVQADEFRVVGTGSVSVVDGTEARFASRTAPTGGAPLTVERAIVHVLEAGDGFRLDECRVVHHGVDLRSIGPRRPDRIE
jgi:cyanophycinase